MFYFGPLRTRKWNQRKQRKSEFLRKINGLRLRSRCHHMHVGQARARERKVKLATIQPIDRSSTFRVQANCRLRRRNDNGLVRFERSHSHKFPIQNRGKKRCGSNTKNVSLRSPSISAVRGTLCGCALERRDRCGIGYLTMAVTSHTLNSSVRACASQRRKGEGEGGLFLFLVWQEHFEGQLLST